MEISPDIFEKTLGDLQRVVDQQYLVVHQEVIILGRKFHDAHLIDDCSKPEQISFRHRLYLLFR